MGLHSADNIRFHLILHALAAEVAIESASPAAEGILFVLVVIFFQLINDSSSHVCVVLARAEGRHHDCASLLVQVSTEKPAWSKNEQEEKEDESMTLLCVLDER